MMKSIRIPFMAALAALAFQSCVKDTLYDTPHPFTGAVTVTADFSAKSPDAALPEAYDIVVDGMAQTVSGPVNTLDRTLAPGTYGILLHNAPDGIDLHGDKASVRSARADGGIHPTPGYLFSGARADLVVRADASAEVTVGMAQHVRRLNVELTVVAGDPSRIVSATATLAGVESAIDLRTGVRAGAAASVSLPYVRSGAALSVAFNLLGVVPEARPALTTRLIYADGESETLVSDLAGDLADFHDSVLPLTLRASLSVPVRSGLSASISDWRKTDAGNVDAH